MADADLRRSCQPSVTGVVLVGPAMAAVAFVRLTSVWAIVTGALLLAAARRCPSRTAAASCACWMISVVWGVLAATVGPKSTIARPCDRIARRAARSSVTYSCGATLRRRGDDLMPKVDGQLTCRAWADARLENRRWRGRGRGGGNPRAPMPIYLATLIIEDRHRDPR